MYWKYLKPYGFCGDVGLIVVVSIASVELLALVVSNGPVFRLMGLLLAFPTFSLESPLISRVSLDLTEPDNGGSVTIEVVEDVAFGVTAPCTTEVVLMAAEEDPFIDMVKLLVIVPSDLQSVLF